MEQIFQKLIDDNQSLEQSRSIEWSVEDFEKIQESGEFPKCPVDADGQTRDKLATTFSAMLMCGFLFVVEFLRFAYENSTLTLEQISHKRYVYKLA